MRVVGFAVSALVWLVCILEIAFFKMRSEVSDLQWLYAGAFIGFVGAAIFASRIEKFRIWIVFGLGLAIRIALIFAVPNLSDDYYRFTWDAHVHAQGISPFEFTPEEYLEAFPEDQKAQELFAANSENFRTGMNSKRFYSVYPAINQWVYQISFAIGSPNEGNLIVMKIIMVLFEVLSFFLIARILSLLGRPELSISWYWLNPLVIIEFVGNLHFEGIAMAFLLFGFYHLLKKNSWNSAVGVGLAIATKINPMFLAMVSLKEWKFKRLILWGAIIAFVSTILFLIYPGVSYVENYRKSLRLYVYVFQFNDMPLNLLYMIRHIIGGKTIGVVLTILPIIAMLAILSLNFLKVQWKASERMILAYAIFFLLSTTVMPWYILMMLPFAVFSKWKSPIIWTYTIFWTYYFYDPEGSGQIDWVVCAEYVILIGTLIYDILNHRRKHRAL